MQQALLELLQYGFNPYQDNSDLEKELFLVEPTNKNKGATENQQESYNNPTGLQQIVAAKEYHNHKEAKVTISISEAFKKTLDLKINMMNKNSFVQYKSRIGLFEKWLREKKYYKNGIHFITKKIVIEYLNEVLIRTSSRNRNNSRTDIESMFQLLEDNELIQDNYVRKIPVLKSVPK